MPNIKLTPKNCQRLLTFCQSGEISPNLVTLPAGATFELCTHSFTHWYEQKSLNEYLPQGRW